MNTNNLNTALYEKMATEQEKYRDWLKSQPPEEILHHTYEYTVREDIVMAMEELELTDAQAQALLDAAQPGETVEVPAEITLPMLRRQEEALRETEFLLFCTGWDRYWGKPRYYEGFPCLTAEAAEYVASLGLKGVGEDSISLDPCDTMDHPNHMILLGAGLVNTENLTGLEALVGKTFTFLTLPLKWEHADGSSCRAMAMLREEETR